MGKPHIRSDEGTAPKGASYSTKSFRAALPEPIRSKGRPAPSSVNPHRLKRRRRARFGRRGKGKVKAVRLIVTGGAGFIGSSFVRHLWRERPDWEIVNLDLLTYAADPESLAAATAASPKHTLVRGDIADADLVQSLFPADAVVNFAAESHVDRSIVKPGLFLRTNVVGTGVLLDAARKFGVGRFLQVSTDEVYGSLGAEGRCSEETPLAPRSPYAASKAAADHLCLSYHHTFGVPALVTRSSNNYGPRQFPEKLIPLLVTNALEGSPLPIYGDGLNVREWLHVTDNCRGILAALERGRPGQVYNLGGGEERTNLEVAGEVLRLLGATAPLIVHVPDRLGHDRRYALDSAKALAELGWRPQFSFGEALAGTVAWYRENEGWWRRIKSGVYREYYARMYPSCVS